jgi:hypothetical protein
MPCASHMALAQPLAQAFAGEPTHHAGSPARAAPGRCALVKIGGHLRHSLRDSGAYGAAGYRPPAPADPRPAAAPGRPGSCRPETRRGPDWHSRDSNDEFPVETPPEPPTYSNGATGAPFSVHSAARSGRARRPQFQAGSRRPSSRPAAENRVAVTGCGGGATARGSPRNPPKCPCVPCPLKLATPQPRPDYGPSGVGKDTTPSAFLLANPSRGGSRPAPTKRGTRAKRPLLAGDGDLKGRSVANVAPVATIAPRSS